MSALTPTSANRCDQFNEACASDLALLPEGGSPFSKSSTLYKLALFTTLCLAAPPSETGTSWCVWEPRHHDRWSQLCSCQSYTMSIRLAFQVLEPTKPASMHRMRVGLAVLRQGTMWRNSSEGGTQGNEGREERYI